MINQIYFPDSVYLLFSGEPDVDSTLLEDNSTVYKAIKATGGHDRIKLFSSDCLREEAEIKEREEKESEAEKGQTHDH